MFGVDGIFIVLALIGLGAVAFFVLRSRSAALPSAQQRRALDEARPTKETKSAAEPTPAPDEATRAREDAGEDEAAEEGAEPSDEVLEPNRDTPEEVVLPSPDASTADDGTPKVDPDASTVDEGGLSLDPNASTVDEGPAVRLPPKEAGAEPVRRFFAPPGTKTKKVGAPSAAEAEPEARPEPKPAARVAVPLPVDKPGRTRDRDAAEAARREAERARYRRGLTKTRKGFVAKLARLFKGKPKVDDDLRDRVEEVLFTADIGTSMADKLQAKVTQVLDAKEVADPDAVWSVIRQAMLEPLEHDAPPPNYAPDPGPYVLLMIGVNGVGKTTTLGKLAAQHHRAGRKVLLVAGDTFRAAAVEQLDVWARRVGCSLHMGADKADPSSVIFEGIARGRREGFDVVLCDTAGRLHTRKELMDELAKVGRAAAKALAKGLPPDEAAAIEGAHDTFLVLDATIGQNALAQAKLFKETMQFTGLVVTKLDGTAKGGVVLGICDELGIPIRYVGVGEGIDDLQAFDAEDFVDALLTGRDDPDVEESEAS